MVRIIATDTGYSNATEYEIGLGVAFSKLLDQGKRYSDSYGWIELVSNVAAELSQRGHGRGRIVLHVAGEADLDISIAAR